MKFSNAEIDRVRRNTTPELLAQIDRKIEENIRFYSSQPKEAIAHRIQELDREWSMERYLETNASSLALAGLLLGLGASRKWLLLTGGVLGFLLQHAIQGWCPPLPLLRRLGIRTRGEIDREKYALKALRGDFKSVEPTEANTASISEVLQAVRA